MPSIDAFVVGLIKIAFDMTPVMPKLDTTKMNEKAQKRCCSGDLLDTKSVPLPVQRVLENLLRNAIDAMICKSILMSFLLFNISIS